MLRQRSTLQEGDCSRKSNGITEEIIPTLLECRNRAVDKANDCEMAKLPGDVYTFNSRDRALNGFMLTQLR